MGWKLITDPRIGSLTRQVGVPYRIGQNSILAHLNTSYYHVHGQPFVSPDAANAVQLTAGAGAWNAGGAIIEVIPAGGLLNFDFDLHWINIADISANGEIQINIYAGAAGNEVLIGATRSQRNAVQSRENANRIQVPQQAAGTRISCRLLDSTAGQLTCNVSFEGHYYVE